MEWSYATTFLVLFPGFSISGESLGTRLQASHTHKNRLTTRVNFPPDIGYLWATALLSDGSGALPPLKV